MNTLNELVNTMIYPQVPVQVSPAPNTVTKEDFEKAFENLQNELEKLKKSALAKTGDLGAHLRLNRPLMWKYTWKGEKKYATLGKERLEYWHNGWEQWRPFYQHEGSATEMRKPN